MPHTRPTTATPRSSRASSAVQYSILLLAVIVIVSCTHTLRRVPATSLSSAAHPSADLPMSDSEIHSVVPLAERTLIDAWISAQNLNPFGDPKGTMYLGGTPLFNEVSGESVEKYEYIVRTFPDRPWAQ
eukprot:TRINITY_DN2723_c0_g1_i4.p1 TRINITY_DN2723_c0_g1~~TRINITY_DN2723_c0_g1_i4.p1  ORF type:complete len:129 (-),score=15.66 TRINITY_DN2723_c0_g1_i4:115-501(-)